MGIIKFSRIAVAAVKKQAPRFLNYFLRSQRRTSRGAVSTAVAGEILRLNFERAAQVIKNKVAASEENCRRSFARTSWAVQAVSVKKSKKAEPAYKKNLERKKCLIY